MTLTKILSKSKISILIDRNSSFISTIVTSLDYVWDDTVPTACTNGKVIKINSKYFKDLNKDERIWLITHEAWHVVFMHMFRLGNRKPKRFNAAADYCINNMLDNSGYILPTRALINHNWDDLSTEQIYDILPDNEDSYPEPDLSYDEGNTEDKSDTLDIVNRATTQAKISKFFSELDLPPEIRDYLDKLNNPKLPWNNILLDYVNDMIQEDYTYKKLNRRYLPQDLIAPSLYSEGIKSICIAIDTSASVSKNEFSSFISEVSYIKDTTKISKFTLLLFDTEIRQELSEVITSFKGGGGTDLTCVSTWVKKNTPELLIVFSDLECDPMVKPLNTDVIWVVVNNLKTSPNYGKVIHYECER